MLSTALKSDAEVFVWPPHWIPEHFAWSNFRAMWLASDFGTALLNSLAISISATPAAYAVSRLPFPGLGTYRMFLLFTQILSPILLVLGLFRMAASVPWGDGSLVDKRITVIVIYTAYNLALAVWMLASYFTTIPRT